MTKENNVQEQRMEQTPETQADKFTWGEGDVQITEPEETPEQAQEERAERFVWQQGDIEIKQSGETQEEQVEMEQEESEPKAIHHATKRGADMSLAKKEISPESHAAVLAGRISLAEARELGRENGPDGPAGSSAKPKKAPKPKTGTCICGCQGETKGGRFIPGHDQRLVTHAKEYVRGERELTDEQLAYVQESGKLDRAKAQVEKEDQRKVERAKAKAAAQRAKEGEQEKQKK